jgi:iron complex transport system substrate-binding protein
MYGKAAAEYPRRIVCLSAGGVEICSALGAGARVVGVPGTVRRPHEAGETPPVGAVTSFRVEKILELEPDLVIAFSDLQADIVATLVRAGLAVFGSNPRSLDDILQTVLLIGGLLGREDEAGGIVQDLRDEIRQVREFSSVWPDRPRVFFEEWPEPLTTGIRWVSEAVEVAGGQDIFPELRGRRLAAERVVEPGEVARRDPEIILASWCGRPLDLHVIQSRPGWDRVSAVRAGQIHEIDGADILTPGPSVLNGLRRIHEIIQSHVARDGPPSSTA